MFKNCSSLKGTVKINGSISKIGNNAFSGCKKIETFPYFLNWNTENLKNTYQIFKDCKKKDTILFNYVN